MNKGTSNLPARGKRTVTFRSALLALLSLMTACAGQVPVQPVAVGSHVQVNTPESRIRNPDAQGGGEAVGKGVAKGAGLGLVGGAGAGIYGSMLCGPLIVFCAPVLIGGGAVVGLVAGGTVGTVAGAMIALPNDKARALDDIIASTLTDENLSVTLRAEFHDQNAGFWSISDTEEAVSITIELESFFIEQFKNDNVQLKMTSTMIVTNGPGKHATTKEIPFAYDGLQHHVDFWLENDGENFRSEVSNAFASNVGQMIRLLKTGSAGSTNAIVHNSNTATENQDLGHADLSQPLDEHTATIHAIDNCSLTAPGRLQSITVSEGQVAVSTVCMSVDSYVRGDFNVQAVADHDYEITWRQVDDCLELRDVTSDVVIEESNCRI